MLGAPRVCTSCYGSTFLRFQWFQSASVSKVPQFQSASVATCLSSKVPQFKSASVSKVLQFPKCISFQSASVPKYISSKVQSASVPKCLSSKGFTRGKDKRMHQSKRGRQMMFDGKAKSWRKCFQTASKVPQKTEKVLPKCIKSAFKDRESASKVPLKCF